MKTTWHLITVNFNGTISYMTSGSYRQMQKLNVHSFHRVTTIANYDKALKVFGL